MSCQRNSADFRRLGWPSSPRTPQRADVERATDSYARPSQPIGSTNQTPSGWSPLSTHRYRRYNGSGGISDARSDQFNLFERKTDMINHGQLAAELLNDAKQVHGNPSHANTLALIGIGNALLQIAEQLGRLDHLRTMVGSLDEISQRP
jgi:hypothetical protein